MPHSRQRLALSYLLRRLKFTPVVALQGARQVGKSFFARELLADELSKSAYVTLDEGSKQSLAQNSPLTFLAELESAHPAMIDEAQKAPGLFDAVKFLVDKDRRPGRFLLLGSTEFSVLQNIRESLTGRMGRVRLYPMTFSELHGLEATKKPTTRADCLKFIKSGGMPGIAFVRDEKARSDFFQDWVELTCQRDIHQFKRLKLDTNLATQILKLCATAEEPTAAHIAKVTRANSKKVGTHLAALTELFVLNRLDPHPTGTGKSVYLLLDSGISNHEGGSMVRGLQILLLNERLVKTSYSSTKPCVYQFYRSTGKNMIHLIEEEASGKIRAFQIFDKEVVKKPDLELLKAFKKKNPKAELHLLAPVTEGWNFEGVRVLPWEWIFEKKKNPSSRGA